MADRTRRPALSAIELIALLAVLGADAEIESENPRLVCPKCGSRNAACMSGPIPEDGAPCLCGYCGHEWTHKEDSPHV